MWAKLDPARVPNMNNVLKDFVRPEGRGVGYMMSAIGILYNKNAMKEPPTSWADLWDPANRGRVTMFDYDARMLAIAARLNGGSEKNPNPGFKVWSDNARNLRALVDSNDAVKNLVSLRRRLDGAVVLGHRQGLDRGGRAARIGDPEGRRDRIPALSRHGQRRHAGAAGGVRGPDQRIAVGRRIPAATAPSPRAFRW